MRYKPRQYPMSSIGDFPTGTWGSNIFLVQTHGVPGVASTPYFSWCEWLERNDWYSFSKSLIEDLQPMAAAKPSPSWTPGGKILRAVPSFRIAWALETFSPSTASNVVRP